MAAHQDGGVIGYYDWLLPENRIGRPIPPSIGLSDVTTGGVVEGALSNLYDRNLGTTYGRTGMDRTSSEIFTLNLQTNLTVGGEQTAFYAIIGAIWVQVTEDDSIDKVAVNSKVTITIDPNSGTYGAGTLYNATVFIGASDSMDAASFPSPNAVVSPWSGAATLTSNAKSNGGLGGTSRSKIQIKVEPTNTTGGSSGVVTYNVRMGRLVLMRGFYTKFANGLRYSIKDPSTVDRAHTGTPYTNQKRAVRTLSGTIVDLDRMQIFGESDSAIAFGTESYNSNLMGVNVGAGLHDEVLIMPRVKPTRATEILDTTIDLIGKSWSNEHIFGLLEAPILARLVDKYESNAKHSWNADFEVTESVGL